MLDMSVGREAHVDEAVSILLAAYPFPGVVEHTRVSPCNRAKFGKVTIRVYNSETGGRVRAVLRTAPNS